MRVLSNDNLVQSVTGLIADYPWMQSGGVGLAMATALCENKVVLVYRNEITKTTTLLVPEPMTPAYHDRYKDIRDALWSDDPFFAAMFNKLAPDTQVVTEAGALLGIMDDAGDNMRISDFVVAVVWYRANVMHPVMKNHTFPLVIFTRDSEVDIRMEIVAFA